MKSIQNQKGFTLVELLLVLGVLALIAIAAFIIYPSVVAGTQANTESSNVTAIVASAKSLYTNGDFTNISTATANQGHVFPSDMNNGDFSAGAQPTSVWGGDVGVAVNGTNKRQMDVTYTASAAAPIPSEACVKFVSGVATNFSDIKVAGTSLFSIVAPSTVKAFQPSLAVANCGDSTADTIVLTSK